MKANKLGAFDFDIGTFGVGVGTSYGLGYGFGAPALGLGSLGSMSVSFTPTGITFDRHVDWFNSVSDYYQIGSEIGGNYQYSGGSLDIQTVWSPSGISHSYDLQQFSGWSQWVNVGDFAKSISHSESTEVIKQHGFSLFGESDSIIYRTDTYDNSHVQQGGISIDVSASTHQQTTEQSWFDQFTRGAHQEISFDSNVTQTHQGPGFYFQHTETSTYYESDTEVVGMMPAYIIGGMHDDYMYGKG